MEKPHPTILCLHNTAERREIFRETLHPGRKPRQPWTSTQSLCKMASLCDIHATGQTEKAQNTCHFEILSGAVRTDAFDEGRGRPNERPPGTSRPDGKSGAWRCVSVTQKLRLVLLHSNS